MGTVLGSVARRSPALLYAMAALLLSAPAGASVADVEIVPDGRGPAPQYRVAPKGGKAAFRSYVEAVRGDRYAVRITNTTGARIGVIIAVDGRNIISGKRSELRPEERMYILPPYGSESYEGWRTDRDTVNRFYFTDPGDSYAAAFGDTSAMGVIAVAVYRERPAPLPLRRTLEKGAPRPSAPGPSAQEPEAGSSADSAGKLRSETPGTGFGEETYSPSMIVAFRPEARAAERHFVKYEWRETLCRKGIVDCRFTKNRFWDDDEGYAPYPPGRTRRGRD